MSQRYHQQKNEEISLAMMSGRERQQKNGSISNWDTEKQFGGQDDTKEASMFKWHAIFLVSCVIAVLYVDPLFLYLPVINQDHKCLFLDERLIITAICFRSIFDLIYVAYIVLGFRCAYKDEEFSRISGRTVFVIDAWKIIMGYLWTYNFLVDILAILPIPQVLVPFIFAIPRSSRFLDIRKVLSLFVLLQYVPRVLRIYLSWKKHIRSSSKLHKRVWIKAAFNIYLYILASHVVPNLAIQGDQNLLERICESLKPKYYNEDIYILQVGEPLMMLFITQGSVCCFKTSNGENSMGTDSDAQYIEKCEIWGEELLEWGFNRSSAHKKLVPISTKIVKTTSKVEAFALTANDLKKLLSMHTRAAEATKVFVKGVFWPYRKENKNENSPKMSDHSGTSSLLKDDAPKSC